MLIAMDSPHRDDIVIGELLTVVVVRAANIVKDVRENIKNLIGGKMTHYEKLIQTTLDEGMDELESKAKEKGYDGVLGVKISNPVVIDGGVEIILYGNGYSVAK